MFLVVVILNWLLNASPFRIDMLFEGSRDFGGKFLSLPFQSDRAGYVSTQLASALAKVLNFILVLGCNLGTCSHLPLSPSVVAVPTNF